MTMAPEQAVVDYEAGAEFERQVGTLIEKGYPRESGLTPEEFTQLLEPLRSVVLDRSQGMSTPSRDRVPFVLVVTKALVPAERAMPLTQLKGRPGFVSADTVDVHRFGPIDTVDIPAGQVYVVLDVDRGAEYRNVRPDDALAGLTASRRSPLTVDEGIAFVTQFPESLEKNHCFSLVASRCGDRRVPALWISKGAPKLGWCWAGNPHTWLGSASCGSRTGAPT